MQATFDFGGHADITTIRDQLAAVLGRRILTTRREPIGQLVKSLISSRTRDEVSLNAYEQLVSTYSSWSDLAAATAGEVEQVIADVTFPDVKAKYLGETLRAIGASHPDFDLGFLRHLPIPEALARLELLPGVGRKVSASTLNFSTLRLPAFVIDTHVLRILRRFGLIGGKADIPSAYDMVTAMTVGWQADDLTELHALLKHLGQTLCRADVAICTKCPIRQRCKRLR